MDTKVCIVGAGPYGIAVAQELGSLGVELAIVGEPFDLWHRHTLESMTLRSACQASEIYSTDSRYGLAGFLEDDRREHPEEDPSGRTKVTAFRRYLLDVTERLPFPVLRAQVTRVERTVGGFSVDCDDGTRIASRAVVVATGLGSHLYMPPALRGLPMGRVLHSWHAREIDALGAGEKILVVGAGQSAAEAVESLRRQHRVTWLLRHPPLFFREPLRVPSPLFKTLLVGSYGLFRVPAVARVAGKLFFRSTITPEYRETYADPGVEKVLSDVESLGLQRAPGGRIVSASGAVYDRIVAATGYRFSLRGLPFLSDALVAELGDRDSIPKLDTKFETSVPNLFMVGGIAEPTFGPAMRFIFGSRHTARRLGRVLEAA